MREVGVPLVDPPTLPSKTTPLITRPPPQPQPKPPRLHLPLRQEKTKTSTLRFLLRKVKGRPEEGWIKRCEICFRRCCISKLPHKVMSLLNTFYLYILFIHTINKCSSYTLYQYIYQHTLSL